MNHVDIGAKTAAGTRYPFSRTRLRDAGMCSFTHHSRQVKPTVSRQKSTQLCFSFNCYTWNAASSSYEHLVNLQYIYDTHSSVPG